MASSTPPHRLTRLVAATIVLLLAVSTLRSSIGIHDDSRGGSSWPSSSSSIYPLLNDNNNNTEERDDDNVKLEPAYQLINRVLHYNHSRRDFHLTLLLRQDGPKSSNGTSHESSPCRLPCFVIQDHHHQLHDQPPPPHDHRISIQGGPTLSEVTAGIGWYLRHVAHVTGLDNWPPLSTSIHHNYHYHHETNHKEFVNLHHQDPHSSSSSRNWPVPVGEGVVLTHHRHLPYSYLMNVCTHSYSLVWYSADDWIQFIDWMALSGINMMLALTGQEWIQYQVFQTMGLSDTEIRTWFNGPAFLTWSRGQNEYGSNIGGPLPLSWMKDQWTLQHDVILPLIRQLDIIGQLPAFQGNVPIQLQELYPDSNMTRQGDTGWMDSLDPLFGTIAKLWMETLIHDFGTDHWYQLDGYFNGGTAPWSWGAQWNPSHADEPLRTPINHSIAGQDEYHDEVWYQRGVKAYEGLNQTDPDAIWSFQGFAFVGWDTPEQASYLKGFVDSVPSKDRFVVMDMSYDPQQPEWAKWNRSAFFGASFVWNVLHNFGGTDGIRGDIRKVNQMPFDVLNKSDHHVFHPIGLGATPEGITQNPAYYRFLFDQAFQPGPRANLTLHLILEMHERYGVDPQSDDFDPDIARSWALLLESLYSTDRSVQDGTGVGHWSSDRRSSLFLSDRYTPSDLLCQVAGAWDHLLRAAQQSRRQGHMVHTSPAFRYDLVNLGREILAQLSTPMALNFSDAVSASVLDPIAITSFGREYQELLLDLDSLVDTEDIFRLGRWLLSARNLGKNSSDCELPTALADDGTLLPIPNGTTSCEIFYEWNARCQVTTWNPTPFNATKVPEGPIDYAVKHWSGLIREYYVKRIALVQAQALEDSAMNQPMNQTRLDLQLARHAYQWTLLECFRHHPDDSRQRHDAIHDEDSYIDVSQMMFNKYKHWFLAPSGYLSTKDVHVATTQ